MGRLPFLEQLNDHGGGVRTVDVCKQIYQQQVTVDSPSGDDRCVAPVLSDVDP
jgi:hypothetical protein